MTNYKLNNQHFESQLEANLSQSTQLSKANNCFDYDFVDVCSAFWKSRNFFYSK